MLLPDKFDDSRLKELEGEARESNNVLKDEELDEDFLSAIEYWTIADAISGNARRFGGLIQQYWDYMYAICYGLAWNRSEAEDLTQDTCVKLWERREQIDPDRGNLKAFFGRVARNVCIDWFRKQKSKGPLAWDQMKAMDEIIEDADETIDIEESIARNELIDRVMQELSPFHCYVLWQRLVLGDSKAEIAEREGCTPPNVGYHERLAKNEFRRLYSRMEVA